jgi:hypothetical protein
VRHARWALAAILSVAVSGAARAGWFDLGLDHDTVQASAGAHFGNDPAGRFALGGRYLWDDESGSRVGALLFGFETEPGSIEGLRFGIGGEVLAARDGDRDFEAGALGVSGTYAPAAMHGFFFGGRLFYAPSVLAWSGAESVVDASARVGFRVTPRIEVFGEYQVVRADLEDAGGHNLVDSILLGFGGRF